MKINENRWKWCPKASAPFFMQLNFTVRWDGKRKICTSPPKTCPTSSHHHISCSHHLWVFRPNNPPPSSRIQLQFLQPPYETVTFSLGLQGDNPTIPSCPTVDYTELVTPMRIDCTKAAVGSYRPHKPRGAPRQSWVGLMQNPSIIHLPRGLQ